MIKRILVALSGTPYTASAIEHSIELARLHDAVLTGVSVVDHRRLADVGPVPLGGSAAAGDLVAYREVVTAERIEAAITSFEDACQRAGIGATVVREQGDPFSALFDAWRYCDLTVFGLRGMFDYGVVAHPVDSIIRLMRKGMRPIVAVSETPRPVKRVLVAYNGSMASANVLKHLVQVPPWPDATFRIACFDRPDDVATRMLSEASDYCAAHGRVVETASAAGHPREVMLDLAREWNVDCVAMGSTPRSRVASWVLGDTALHTLRTTHVALYLSSF